MPLEQAEALLPLETWFPLALTHWLVVVAGVLAAAVVIGWLVGALRQGPRSGFRLVGRVLFAVTGDVLRMSARRVWALSWLAVRESIRRRVVVVFAVFIVILLFAGWFLDPASARPARLYLAFVLTATSYLVLLLALFLSALSLPIDIKNKTLHTVVTKPVRPSEIVLGRICGFAAVGTFLLVLMGAISYFFVVRGLSHTHELTDADLHAAEQASDEQTRPREGFTKPAHRHRHAVTIEPTGEGRVAMARNHWHELTIEPSADKTVHRVGPPRGMLVARVPIYGKLRFKDRAGKDAEKGINVGDEWAYRSFIEGGTLATAIWSFEGITEEKFPQGQFPEGLPLETTIEVFRSYKGDTDDPENIPGILGTISIRNPKTGKIVEAKIFTAKEFTTDVLFIPRKLQTPNGKTLDLFKDLVVDGKVEVWLRCAQPMQYFGAAQGDVYFRARDASFGLNFAKGYLGIWLQMVLIIAISVMFSTFLSGPVTIIATTGALIGGLFSGFMMELARGQVIGGGPFEALHRILLQQNLVSKLEPGFRTMMVETLDTVFCYPLYVAASILPGFGQFSFANHVAYGFDISGVAIFESTCRAMAFLLPLFVAACLFLKTREVAK